MGKNKTAKQLAEYIAEGLQRCDANLIKPKFIYLHTKSYLKLWKFCNFKKDSENTKNMRVFIFGIEIKLCDNVPKNKAWIVNK